MNHTTQAIICGGCLRQIKLGEWYIAIGGGTGTTTYMPPAPRYCHLSMACQWAHPDRLDDID
jgi:hypothetical protein